MDTSGAVDAVSSTCIAEFPPSLVDATPTKYYPSTEAL